MAITLNIPTGAQPRGLVLEVVRDNFEHGMRLAEYGGWPRELEDALALARAAQEREDVVALLQELRNVCVASMGMQVRLLATLEEELQPA